MWPWYNKPAEQKVVEVDDAGDMIVEESCVTPKPTFLFMLNNASGRATLPLGPWGDVEFEEPQETAGRALKGALPGQRAYQVKYDLDAQRAYREDQEKARAHTAHVLQERATQQELVAARRARDKEEAIDELRSGIRDTGLWINPADQEACKNFVDMAALSDINTAEAMEIITSTWLEHTRRVLY
jgi:hypothetical protein